MKNKKIKNNKILTFNKKNKIKTQYINKKFNLKLKNFKNNKYQNNLKNINKKLKQLKKNLHNISILLKQKLILKFLKINKFFIIKKFKKIQYYYKCLWFLKNKNIKKKIFKYYTLKKIALKKNYFNKDSISKLIFYQNNIFQNTKKNNIKINIFKFNKGYNNNTKNNLTKISLNLKKQKNLNLYIKNYFQIIQNFKFLLKIKRNYILLKNNIYYNLKKTSYNFLYLRKLHYKKINQFFKVFKQIQKLKYNEKIYKFLNKKIHKASKKIYNKKKLHSFFFKLLKKYKKLTFLFKNDKSFNLKKFKKFYWLHSKKVEIQRASVIVHKKNKRFFQFFTLYKKLPKFWILNSLIIWLKFNFNFYLKNFTQKIRNFQIYYKIFKYQKIHTFFLTINKNKQQLYYFFKKEFYIPLLLKLKKIWKRFLIFEIINSKIKKIKKNLKIELIPYFKYTTNLNNNSFTFNKNIFQLKQDLINNLLINFWQNIYIEDTQNAQIKYFKITKNIFLLKKTIKIKKWKKFIKFGFNIFLKKKIINLYTLYFFFIHKKRNLHLKTIKKNLIAKKNKKHFNAMNIKKKLSYILLKKKNFFKRKKIILGIQKLKKYLKKYIKLYIFFKNININNKKLAIGNIRCSNKIFNSKIPYLFFNFNFLLKKFLFYFKWNNWKQKQKKFKKKLQINFSFFYDIMRKNFYQKLKIKEYNLDFEKRIICFKLLEKKVKYFKNNNNEIDRFHYLSFIELSSYKNFKRIKMFLLYVKVCKCLKFLKFKKLKFLKKLKNLKFSNINITNLNYYKCIFKYLKLINTRYTRMLYLEKNIRSIEHFWIDLFRNPNIHVY